MKKWIKENFNIFSKVILLISIIFILIVLSLFQLNPNICEWLTRTISRFYQTGIGFIFKYIPFSIIELISIALIIFGIVLIIQIIKTLVKKQYKIALNKSLIMSNIILSIVTGYVATTSLAYYRLPIPIPLYNEHVEKEKFNGVVQYFLDDYNYCSSQLEYYENGEVKMPYSRQQLANNIINQYSKIKTPYLSSFTTNPKAMLTSFLYVEFQITGVYSGLTGEVNYDYYMTNGEYPFTFAHEIAHSKGVMRENDAQLLAAYICLNSSDIYLRYSAYLYTFTSLLSLTKYTGNKDDYKNMVQQMDESIIKNYDYISKYWKEHDILGDFGEFFNNLYLKLFGGESTDSYDDTPVVVDPSTNEIKSFSRYQKLYFQRYVDLGNNLK